MASRNLVRFVGQVGDPRLIEPSPRPADSRRPDPRGSRPERGPPLVAPYVANVPIHETFGRIHRDACPGGTKLPAVGRHG